MSQFLDNMRDKIRVRHLAYKTEKTYLDWAERFIRFHKMRHPKDMDTSHVERFVIHLANSGVSASTQNQSIAALKFMFREMTTVEIGDIRSIYGKREVHV